MSKTKPLTDKIYILRKTPPHLSHPTPRILNDWSMNSFQINMTTCLYLILIAHFQNNVFVCVAPKSYSHQPNSKMWEGSKCRLSFFTNDVQFNFFDICVAMEGIVCQGMVGKMYRTQANLYVLFSKNVLHQVRLNKMCLRSITICYRSV